MNTSINAREPGLVALEQTKESTANFGVISIPRFSRRLAFAPQDAYDGRRVEWVPYTVSEYMMKRFNKTGRVQLHIAYDLMNGNQGGLAGAPAAPLTKADLRGMLKELVQEDWFQQLLRYGGSSLAAAVAAPLVSPPAEVPAQPADAADAPYVPRARSKK